MSFLKQKSIKINGNEVLYHLEIKPRNKSLRLLVKDGKVIIRHNGFFSEKQINNLIEDNISWVMEQISKENLRKENLKKPVVYFLGREYKKVIEEGPYAETAIKGDSFLIKVNNKEYEEENALNKFYLIKAEDFIYKRVKELETKMGLYSKKISLKALKSKWGSCNMKNHLVFNVFLMRFQKEVIDYVIIHELAHIKHKNHGANFWGLVEKYCPDYKKTQKALVYYAKTEIIKNI